MKPLLVLKVGDALPVARAHGEDFDSWIARGLEVPVAVRDVRSAGAPPAPAGFAGAVISGSGSMVTERLDWSEELASWLRRAVEAQLPLLGICYGHQLLAHALGGEVDYHPGGMELGTVTVTTTAEAADDPLFGPLAPGFAAQAVHSQSVRRLPPGAVCLAANEFEPHHGFRYGRCAWGVQFHPEFDQEAMRGYLDKYAPLMAADGFDVESAYRRLAPTAEAGTILRRFARLAVAAQAE